MKERFIIGSIDKKTGGYSISQNPHIHTSLNEAENEAERLAKEFNDKKFIVFELCGIVSASSVLWE